MSDTILPGNVFAKAIVDYQKKVLAGERRTEVSKLRAACWRWRGLSAILFLLVVLLAGAIRAMAPLKELLPIILWRHDNGAVEAAITPQGLPMDMQDATIKVFLWQYTAHREGYASQTLDLDHHIVMAMSDKKVAAAYDQWVGAHSNPKSYQNIFGDKCQVFVALAIGDPQVEYIPPGPKGSRPGHYKFHYWRRLQCTGEAPQQATEWTAAIEFIAGYQGAGLNWTDILQFNSPRIVVTGYAAPVPVSAIPKDIIN